MKESTSQPIRLQRFISNAGVTSRRKAEDLIAQGKVSVNGERITSKGFLVHPRNDVVRVNGRQIKIPASLRAIVINKPRMYISSREDPQGRPTVMSLLPSNLRTLKPVGRLDFMTDGVLILTNDGDLANRICHPRFNIIKTYVAKVRGVVQEKTLLRLKKGVMLDDGPAKAHYVDIIGRLPNATWVRISVGEGRKHIVRRMLKKLRHAVVKLKRTRIGPVRASGLKPGDWRFLRPDELKLLTTTKSVAETTTKRVAERGSGK